MVTQKLPNTLKSLGQSLSRKLHYKSIARAAFKCKQLKNELLKLACKEIGRECEALKKLKGSVLKKTTPNQLKSFTWKSLAREWKGHAPTFYMALKAAALPCRKKCERHTAKTAMPVVGTAGAILLKLRSPKMSAVQHLIGLMMFLGGLKKKVSFSRYFYNFFRRKSKFIHH